MVWRQALLRRPLLRNQPEYTVCDLLPLGLYHIVVPRYGAPELPAVCRPTYNEELLVMCRNISRSSQERMHSRDCQVLNLQKITLHSLNDLPSTEAGYHSCMLWEGRVEDNETRKATGATRDGRAGQGST